MWYNLKRVKCNFPLLFKNIHIRLSTLKIYFNKIFILLYFLLFPLYSHSLQNPSSLFLSYFLPFSLESSHSLPLSLSLSKTQHNPKSPSNQPPSMEQPTIIKQLAIISPFSHHKHINPTLITQQNTWAIAMFTKTQLQPTYSHVFSKRSLNY